VIKHIGLLDHNQRPESGGETTGKSYCGEFVQITTPKLYLSRKIIKTETSDEAK